MFYFRKCLVNNCLFAKQGHKKLQNFNLYSQLQHKAMETKEYEILLAQDNSPPSLIPSQIGRAPQQTAQHKAVNLGQGFSDAEIPQCISKHLIDVSMHPERTDLHQYTRGYGHGRLVNILARFYSKLLDAPIDPQTNVLVTVGAYLALYYSFIGWLNPGDEVIIFEPAYDSYVTQIKMAGGIPVPIVLEYDETQENASKAFRLNIEEIKAKMTSKTKMLVLNNPNNPTGKLFTRTELEAIAQIVEENNLLVVADEVYEWHVFPGNEMIRFGNVQSYNNHWKCRQMGWALGPKWILEPLKKVHENCVFTCPTPTQAIARAFEEEHDLMEAGKLEDSYLFTGMAKELLPKRDLLAKLLRRTGFTPIIPDSGYFMMTSFSHIIKEAHLVPIKENDPLDYQFKLAAIPPSAFYSPENRLGNDQFIRFCFFKKNETLEAAAKILEQNFNTV